MPARSRLWMMELALFYGSWFAIGLCIDSNISVESAILS